VLVSANLDDESLEENSRIVAPGRAVRCSSVATRWALVALGRADVGLTIFNSMAPWDFAGAQAILQGLGGDVVDGQGAPILWDGVYPQKQVRHFFGARSTALAADVARRYREHGQ
jgi:fructose-1,6-bisphosphatase/inositol monophosphatase family enzyme